MPGYLKFDGVDGESADGYTKVEWTYQAKAKLQKAGISQMGITALTTGAAINDPKDRKVVANILAQVFNTGAGPELRR